MSKEKYRRYVFEKHKDHISATVRLLYDYSCGGSWVFSSMGNTHAVYLWGWSAPKGHPQPHRLTQINVLYSEL